MAQERLSLRYYRHEEESPSVSVHSETSKPENIRPVNGATILLVGVVDGARNGWWRPHGLGELR